MCPGRMYPILTEVSGAILTPFFFSLLASITAVAFFPFDSPRLHHKLYDGCYGCLVLELSAGAGGGWTKGAPLTDLEEEAAGEAAKTHLTSSKLLSHSMTLLCLLACHYYQ